MITVYNINEMPLRECFQRSWAFELMVRNGTISYPNPGLMGHLHAQPLAPPPGVLLGVNGAVPVRKTGKVWVEPVVQEELLVVQIPGSHQCNAWYAVSAAKSRLLGELDVGYEGPEVCLATCYIVKCGRRRGRERGTEEA
jgi:hypothetical protein